MENENNPLVEETTTNQENGVVAPSQDENVSKTYSQAEVDELLKGRFTQEQVNAMIEKRLKRVSKDTAKASEIDTSQIEKYKNDLISTQIKLAEYEKKSALAGYQIEDEYKDFIDYKVTHMTSKDKDYSTALSEYMAGDGARYIKKAVAPTPRPQNTGVPMDETQRYIFEKYGKKIGQ